MVYVRERKVFRGLAAAYGDAAYFGLQAKGNGMDAGYFGATSGNALDFGDQSAAHQRLERICIDVDKEAESGEKSGNNREEQIPPPSAGGFSRGLGH